jgi:hypothetical protein
MQDHRAPAGVAALPELEHAPIRQYECDVVTQARHASSLRLPGCVCLAPEDDELVLRSFPQEPRGLAETEHEAQALRPAIKGGDRDAKGAQGVFVPREVEDGASEADAEPPAHQVRPHAEPDVEGVVRVVVAGDPRVLAERTEPDQAPRLSRATCTW